jgi:hypothetical protein
VLSNGSIYEAAQPVNSVALHIAIVQAESELNPEYCALIEKRLNGNQMELLEK